MSAGPTPMRFIPDDEALELEQQILEIIHNSQPMQRNAWVRGLTRFLLSDSFPRHGCQEVSRRHGRNGLDAPIHSVRRWVAAQLYERLGFSRGRVTKDAIWVHVEPLFRMPALRVFLGLVKADTQPGKILTATSQTDWQEFWGDT